MRRWAKRFLARGVFWRQMMRWTTMNVAPFVEPVVIATWSLLFLLWGSARRGVMRNLAVIKPASWTITNFFRTYRVLWNFSWTMADQLRFKHFRKVPDWEFAGLDHFAELESRTTGAIVLTAHMGNYDLGAHVFSTVSRRRMVMVRAPEIDPETQQFEERAQNADDGLRVNFNVKPTDLAIDLLHAIEAGDLVAIQGDRVTPGVGSMTVEFFGKPVPLPVGPFALAMASRTPIYPLFIIRAGRRRYLLQACPPILVQRRSRNREEDLRPAVQAWARQLELVVRAHWQQWFAFEPFYEELAA